MDVLGFARRGNMTKAAAVVSVEYKTRKTFHPDDHKKMCLFLSFCNQRCKRNVTNVVSEGFLMH